MQTTWITRGQSDRLRVVALGWAADPTVVKPRADYDTVCVYDYRTIEPLIIKGYREVHMVAWSYGVWAAEQIFEGQTFTSAVAINGTPYPTSEQYGIPQRLFAMTVANINISKFVQRMCIGMTEPIKLVRDENECIEELRALAEHFKRDYTPSIVWTKAIIGMKDLIYPPAAQIRYWDSVGVIQERLEKEPHYVPIN